MIELDKSDRPEKKTSNINYDAAKLTEKLRQIEATIENAESRAYPRTNLPNKLNGFPLNLSKKIQEFILKIFNLLFKDQREVNLNLINSLKESVALNRQLIEEINELRSQIDCQLGTVNTRIQSLDERWGKAETRIQSLDERWGEAETRIQSLDERWGEAETRTQSLDERWGEAETRTQSLNERYARNDNYLKNDLMQQKRLIAMFLEEARKRLPESFNREQLQTFIKEDRHLLDAFYVAFENEFRGSCEEIKSRLHVYLPLIEEAKVGMPDSPILDIGCGRGEWLELLRSSGYTAKGLDINRVMIEQCHAINLEVIEADAMIYLQSLPDNSVGAVTGFHIIEHLPFPVLMKFFSEVTRILKTGGLAIFETPNPHNFLVSTHNFYIDPTHLNPLPIPLVKFIAQKQGLSNIKVMELHPHPQRDEIYERYKVIGSEIAEILNKHFYGPGDYAVVGYNQSL